jgi:hypothetical protein
MRLSTRQIADYRRIYQKVFGTEIDEKEAIEQSLALLTIVKTVTKNENELNHGNETQLRK